MDKMKWYDFVVLIAVGALIGWYSVDLANYLIDDLKVAAVASIIGAIVLSVLFSQIYLSAVFGERGKK